MKDAAAYNFLSSSQSYRKYLDLPLTVGKWKPEGKTMETEWPFCCFTSETWESTCSFISLCRHGCANIHINLEAQKQCGIHQFVKQKHFAETDFFLKHLQEDLLGFHELSWLTPPSTRHCHCPGCATAPEQAPELPHGGLRRSSHQSLKYMLES